jgi:integrase
MSRRTQSVPSYRRHEQSGQAVVTLTDGLGGRRDVLLGPHGTAASRVEYARVIAEWEAGGRRLTTAPAAGPGLSVNEVLLAFLRFAEQHYRYGDGSPTNELSDYKLSLRPLRELYGHTPAASFGPLALKAVRGRMVEAGLCRGVVNQRIGRIKRMFKWAASEELVPATVYQALATVAGLAKGRGAARETEAVQPVPDAFVDAVLPFVLPPVRALVQLQRLTGMRPGEACRLRACDLDTTGPVWLYRPAQHKTAWRGKSRVIALGPQAQAVLKPFLTLDTQAYLFSPARAMADLRDRQRAGRKTRVQPSQQDRRRRKPEKLPGERYTSKSYARAIAKACAKADAAAHRDRPEVAADVVLVPHWHPNQLRHNHATEVRRRYGLEAAQVALGHSRADVTQVYAERDLGLAERIAREIG